MDPELHHQIYLPCSTDQLIHCSPLSQGTCPTTYLSTIEYTIFMQAVQIVCNFYTQMYTSNPDLNTAGPYSVNGVCYSPAFTERCSNYAYGKLSLNTFCIFAVLQWRYLMVERFRGWFQGFKENPISQMSRKGSKQCLPLTSS